MKRIILFLCCLLLISCTNSKYDKQIEEYNRFLIDAKEKQNISNDLPFDIKVYCEQIIDDEITYRIIIDNPKEEINNIKAIAVHNIKTEDIYPTSGIFEDPLNLIPNDVNLDKNNAKGIILIGYIDYEGKLEDFKVNINVLIEYVNSNDELIKTYYEYHK